MKSLSLPPYSAGNGSPNKPELTHGQHGLGGEGVIAIPRFGIRRDRGASEVAHDLAELLLLVAEVELHGGDLSPRAWRTERALRSAPPAGWR